MVNLDLYLMIKNLYQLLKNETFKSESYEYVNTTNVYEVNEELLEKNLFSISYDDWDKKRFIF